MTIVEISRVTSMAGMAVQTVDAIRSRRNVSRRPRSIVFFVVVVEDISVWDPHSMTLYTIIK